MSKSKRGFYTVIGFVTWRVLAIFGLKAAKDKVAQHRQQQANT